MRKSIVLLFLIGLTLSGFVFSAQAQVNELDSIEEFKNARIIIDTTARKLRVKKQRKKFDPSRPQPDPKKAALFSAVLPGLGQAYNRKYWKIPIVYGAAIGMGIAIDYNHGVYIELRTALFALIDGDPETVVEGDFSTWTESRLRSVTDEFRNNRDQLIIYSGVLYALNIIEAHIDAHLREFNINEDLALKIKPTATSSFTGITLALKIK